jgi:hypothetical protein
MLDLDKFIAGMDEEQLTNLRKVMKTAQKYNINPEFVLPMVKAESNFKHVKNPNSGAFGVMQLMPATASSLKVDSNDVDENIEGGMRLLKELSENKKIGTDPYKILAGYNANPTTPFLTSGNLDDLPLETLNHMRNVSKYYGGVLPSLNAGEQEEQPSNEEAPSDIANPRVTAGAPPPPNTRAQDANVTNGAPELSDKALALLGGGVGLTVGTTGVLAPKAYGLIKGAGNYLFGGNTPAPIPRVEPSLTPAAGEVGGLSAAQQGEQLAQNLERDAASASGGRGVKGWLAGRTSGAIPVPEELVENVATLKGQGPASASFAEAQHAANVEKLLEMGEPPSRWKPAVPGGKVVVSTAPQTAGPRAYGPAPLKVQAAQTGPFPVGSGEVPVVGGARGPAPTVAAAAPQPAAALPTTAPAAQGESALGRLARGAGNVVRPIANIGLSGLSGVLSAKELYEAEKNRRMYGWTPETTLQYMSGLGGLIGTVPTLPTRVVGGAMQVIPMMARPGNYKAYEDAANAGLY